MTLPVASNLIGNFVFLKSGVPTNPAVAPTLVSIRLPSGAAPGSTPSLTNIAAGVYQATVIGSADSATAGVYGATAYTTDSTMDYQAYEVEWEVGTNDTASISSGIWSYLKVSAAALGVDTIGRVFSDLLDHLTTARADKLDHLNADIDSRLATTAYTTPPTVAAIRTEMDTNSVDLNTIINNQTTINNNVLAINPLDASETAAAVLDALDTDHDLPNTIGAQINNAGSAVDPLGNEPGDYTEGEIGNLIGLIKAKTDGISVGRYYSVNPYPPESVLIALKRGDDYLAIDGRAFEKEIVGMPPLPVGGVGQFISKKRSGGTWTVLIEILTETRIRIEFPRTESVNIIDSTYEVKVTLANDDVITVLEGPTKVD